MKIVDLYRKATLYNAARHFGFTKEFDFVLSEMSKAKVQRCALVGLGLLVALRISPLAMVCIGGSIFSSYYFIKDYEDPQEIAAMRKRALSSDFLTLIKDHGSIAKILDTKILTHKELSDKVNVAVAEAKKIHSEELPKLQQFQKQMSARKDPDAKIEKLDVIKKIFFWT